MVKETYCVELDNELVDIVEKKLGLSINEIVNNYLELVGNNDSIEGSLLFEMAKKRKELDRLEKEFFTIQDKKIRLDSHDDLKIPFGVINRVYEKCGVVGRNQLKFLARNYHVSVISLEKLCLDKNISLVNYLESPRR
jgi:hypothetical protein